MNKYEAATIVELGSADELVLGLDGIFFEDNPVNGLKRDDE